MLKVLAYMIEAHIVRQKENNVEFLLLKRASKEIFPNLWQMVTGSITTDERAYETAYREIIEESGIIPKKMWVVPFVNSFYSWKRNHMCIVPVFAAMVDSNAAVVISHEHSEYKWVNRDLAKQMLAWQGQRTSVDIIYDRLVNKDCTLYFEELRLDKIKLRQINK